MLVKSHKIGIPSRLLVGLVSTLLAFPATVPLAYAQGSQQQSGAAQLSEAQLAALVAPYRSVFGSAGIAGAHGFDLSAGGG